MCYMPSSWFNGRKNHIMIATIHDEHHLNSIYSAYILCTTWFGTIATSRCMDVSIRQSGDTFRAKFRVAFKVPATVRLVGRGCCETYGTLVVVGMGSRLNVVEGDGGGDIRRGLLCVERAMCVVAMVAGATIHCTIYMDYM